MSKKSEEKPKSEAPGKATGFYEVSLPHGPVAVVEANDEAAAWDAYCKQEGVIKSKHQPTITPCDPPAKPEPPAAT
jgi:hypothetical protein